jgi:hypothetical protein
MVEESVEQLKKQRVIEHVELAISDLQRYQTNPIVISTMVQLHDALVGEYNALFIPKPAEEESSHPTIHPPVKDEKKVDVKK